MRGKISDNSDYSYLPNVGCKERDRLQYFFELGCHSFADRFPVDREFARLVVCPTNVGETQKAEVLGLPYSTPLPVLSELIGFCHGFAKIGAFSMRFGRPPRAVPSKSGLKSRELHSLGS